VSEPRARCTASFDLCVAKLTQRMSKSAVERTAAIAWRTVERCVERVMRRFDLDDELRGLKHVGIDEIRFRKGHRYLTLVADPERGRIVWGCEGKGRKPVEKFFAELGARRTRALETVCSDMDQGIVGAVADCAPDALHVVDRFHLQALATEALDETRRQELGRFPTAATVGARWVLLKNPDSFTAAQQESSPRSSG